MSGEKEEARATLQRHQQVSELGHGRPRGLQPCKGRQKTPRSSGHVCTPSETGEVTRFGGRVGATGLNGRRCRSGPTLCGLEPGDHGGMRPAYPSLSPSHPPPQSVITEYQVELPVLFSNFPVAVLHVILHMIVVSATLHSSPPLPSLCPQVHSPHLHLQSFPAHRFSSTTFLESIDMR